MLKLLLRVPVPWVFVLTYLAGAGMELLLPIHRSASAVISIIGAVLFVIGAVIAGWSLTIFRKAHTTTVPGMTSARLVTWGPYRRTRNPMYVGLTLAYLGEAALLHQIWPVIFLPLTLLYVNSTVIPLEEKRLNEAFPSEYEAYRSSVRRWM